MNVLIIICSEFKENVFPELSCGVIEVYKTSIEGEIVKKIGDCIKSEVRGAIVINPLSYRNSIAIYDALKAANMNNIITIGVSENKLVEDGRHRVFSACQSFIAGFGENVYLLADKAIKYLDNYKKPE